MLDELSMTINNRESISVDNHPGMKPLVTGLDNIKTSAEIIPILSSNKIHFLNLHSELNCLPYFLKTVLS